MKLLCFLLSLLPVFAVVAQQPISGQSPQLDMPTLTAVKRGPTQIDLTITPVANATEYVVEGATDEAFSQPIKLHTGRLTDSVTATTISATGLALNTPYFFRVIAQADGYEPSPFNVRLATTGTVHTMGGGAGILRVDGRGVRAGDIIKLTPGKYHSFLINNLAGTSEKRIYIVPDGPVVIDGDGSNDILLTVTDTPRNLNYVTLDGRINPAATTRSISFQNGNYRGIDIPGNLTPQFFELSWCKFNNINDYTLIWNSFVRYDGTPTSAFNGFKFTHNLLTNCYTLNLGGALTGPVNRGLVKDPEFAYNTFQDRPNLGSAINLAHSDNYNIHDNIVNRVNTATAPGSEANNHNGIFFLRGWGRFYNNRITNHQGNAVRAWTYALGVTHPTLEIYNNIVCQSRRYAAFEIQEFAENLFRGMATYPNAKVYNNTGVNLNTHTPTVYTGVILDLYNFSGTTEVFNNVLANGRSQPGTNAVGVCSLQGSGSARLRAHHNYVFGTYRLAGIANLTDFNLLPTSPLKKKGVITNRLKTDIFGRQRPEVPAAGAVE